MELESFWRSCLLTCLLYKGVDDRMCTGNSPLLLSSISSLCKISANRKHEQIRCDYSSLSLKSKASVDKVDV